MRKYLIPENLSEEEKEELKSLKKIKYDNNYDYLTKEQKQRYSYLRCVEYKQKKLIKNEIPETDIVKKEKVPLNDLKDSFFGFFMFIGLIIFITILNFIMKLGLVLALILLPLLIIIGLFSLNKK